MSSDLFALSALAEELNRTLSGAKIDKITQPDSDELRFYLRKDGKSFCLCASCNSGAPRLNVTVSKKQNPVTAPTLCMLLRKHLSVSMIESVKIYNFDRTLQIKFLARTEMKDNAVYYLYVEIMNRYSNIIFADENNVILDAVKHLPLDVERNHVVLRGIEYKSVVQPKTSYLTNCFSVFDNFKSGDLHQFLLDNLSGFSGVTASEFLKKAGVQPYQDSPLDDKTKNALITTLKEYQNIFDQPYFSPCIIGKKEVYPYPYAILQGEIETFATMSAAYDKLYTATDEGIRNKARLKNLSTAVKHLKARIEKNVKTDVERLEECKNMDEYKLCGEMIVANIYRIQKGDTVLQCENYYNGESMSVKLDSQLSPSQNSKFYYTKYNKLKRQQEFTTKKLEDDKRLLQYVLSIEKELSSLPYDASYTPIEEELERLGAVKRKNVKGKVRKEKAEPPYTYSYGGFTIMKGRNNLQNDELTFRIAGSQDVWLHLKNGHGPHVIILTEGKTVTDDVIKIACEIAAGYEQSSANVDYTERRNVKRMPNGHPGQVIYVNYKTALAEPNLHNELLKH